MNLEELTIIIPVYNQPLAILERCLKSLSFFTGCLVLVDDGSDEEYPSQYADCLNRWVQNGKFITVPHQGVSIARNKGLAQVKTPYVMFVDSDDELSPFAQTILLSIEVQEKPKVVCFGSSIVSSLDCQFNTHFVKETFSCVDVMMHLMKKKVITKIKQASFNLASPWAKIYPTQWIQTIEFVPGLSWNEDFLFNLQVLAKLDEYGFDSRNLYLIHTEDKHSLSRSVTVETIQAQIPILAEACQTIDENLQSYLSQMILNQMILISKHSQDYKGLKSYLIAEKEMVRWVRSRQLANKRGKFHQFLIGHPLLLLIYSRLKKEGINEEV